MTRLGHDDLSLQSLLSTDLPTYCIYRLGHDDVSLQLGAFAEEEEADLAQLEVPAMAVPTTAIVTNMAVGTTDMLALANLVLWLCWRSCGPE